MVNYQLKTSSIKKISHSFMKKDKSESLNPFDPKSNIGSTPFSPRAPLVIFQPTLIKLFSANPVILTNSK